MLINSSSILIFMLVEVKSRPSRASCQTKLVDELAVEQVVFERLSICQGRLKPDGKLGDLSILQGTRKFLDEELSKGLKDGK